MDRRRWPRPWTGAAGLARRPAPLASPVDSDANWKTLSTYAGFLIMMLGMPIDFGSKLIRVVCHSTAEAEIAAEAQQSATDDQDTVSKVDESIQKEWKVMRTSPSLAVHHANQA